MRWNWMSKALRFLQITAEQQDCPFFTVFLTTKSLSQNISITFLQIPLKLHEHRGCYWRKKLQWMIFEEQFPVPRYTAASKIGNSVISLLWQLWGCSNADHNKFSSSSNTTVVAIFPKLCLWWRRLCSNLGSIGSEKLYRATLPYTFDQCISSVRWSRTCHSRYVCRLRWLASLDQSPFCLSIIVTCLCNFVTSKLKDKSIILFHRFLLLSFW